MNKEAEAASTQTTPVSPSPGDSGDPVSTSPMTIGLRRALAVLAFNFCPPAFLRVKTAYSEALRACGEQQSFALSQATVDRYLQLTAEVYKRTAVKDFTRGFCVSWLNGLERGVMLTNMQKCGAEHFCSLLRDCLQGREEVLNALRTAVRAGRSVYVKWFCTIACDFQDMAQTIVDVVWNVRHDHMDMLLRHCACCSYLPGEVIWRYVVKTFNETDSWKVPHPNYDMAPVVNWVMWTLPQFRHLHLAQLGFDVAPEQKELLPDFVNFCLRHGACLVALFMATMLRDWQLVYIVLRERPEELRQPLFPLPDLVSFMQEKVPIKILTDIVVATIDGSPLDALRFEPKMLRSSELHTMSIMSNSRGHTKWGAFFLMHTEQWRRVVPQLNLSDHDAVGLVLVVATSYGRWNVVESLLPYVPNDAATVNYIFQRVAREGEADLVERLLPRVDLSLLPFVDGGHDGPLAIFNSLVNFTTRTRLRQRVQIVLLLVKTGVVSHCLYGERVVMRAIQMGMPTMARLLFDVGLVSNEQFSHVVEELHYYLRSQPTLKRVVNRVVESAKLNCPRTLLNSCRLVLSHRVGFGRNRLQRIEQLPLPSTLRRVVALRDLYEPVEAKLRPRFSAFNYF